MKKLMDWLSESFAPNANKLFSKPWIAAISSAMQKVVPFILTGSLIYFYNVILLYLSFPYCPICRLLQTTVLA